MSLLPGHVVGAVGTLGLGLRGPGRESEEQGGQRCREPENVTLTYKWRHSPLETVTPGHGGCLSRGLPAPAPAHLGTRGLSAGQAGPEAAEDRGHFLGPVGSASGESLRRLAP